MTKPDRELQDLMSYLQVRHLEELREAGRDRRKIAIAGVASGLPASVIVAAIAAFTDLSPWFFVSAFLLFVSAVWSWVNLQRINTFLATIENDIKEIQK